MDYDLIIIGAGPAGYSAGIYAARYNLRVLLVAEKRGGLITSAHLVENYPGYKSISGVELMNNFYSHLKEYENVDVVEGEVLALERRSKGGYLVRTFDSEFEGRSLIFATGTKRRKLDVEGEDDFVGKGVSYCATCDAMFFRNKSVVVVGGGNGAILEAMMLSDVCKRVFVVNIAKELGGEEINIDNLRSRENVEIINSDTVSKVVGGSLVEKVVLSSGREVECSGVFVSIGHLPQSDLAKSIGVELNKFSEIIVDKSQRTNLVDVYAAGDVTNLRFKQVITSASDGSVAAWSVYRKVKMRRSDL